MDLFPTNVNSPGTNSFGQPKTNDSDLAKPSTESPTGSNAAHYRADTDSAQQALHHTLGPRRNQAAPGSHTHDGISSRLIGDHTFDASNPGQTVATWSIARNTWQIVGAGSAPTYNSGWSGTTTFTGITPVPSLMFCLNGNNHLWLNGAFQAGASAGANLFTLPSGYYDTSNIQGFPVMEKQASGTFQIGFGYVSTLGIVHIDLGANFTRNSGDAYYINAIVPCSSSNMNKLPDVISLLHNFVDFREL